MDQPSQPPPSSTLIAAAAGGFGGAVLGVLAATMLTGDGDNGDANARNVEAETPKVEVAAVDP